MRYVPEDEEEPPQVRRLRLLVMALLVVLMVGFVAMVGTIVIRLGFGVGQATGSAAAGIAMGELVLPDGEIVATGQGPGTLHVILRAPDGRERVLIFDARTGARLSETAIRRE